MKGTGDQIDYGMRMYDPRVGRFMSVDQLTNKYPELTPYQYASNRPVDGVDQDGLEWEALATPLKIDEHGKAAIDIQGAKDNVTTPSRAAIAATFKFAFTQELPKKFIDHFVWGKGEPYRLSAKETEDIHIAPTGWMGGVDNDIKKANELLAKTKPGESSKLPEGYSIQGAARNAGTLGRFTIYLQGVVTKDKENPNKWSFKGQMQIYDIYDFESAPTKPGDLQRNDWGNFQTDFANQWLKGTSFEVRSAWIPVEQNYTNYFNWFDGKNSDVIGNKLSSNSSSQEVQKTANETSESKK